MNGDNSTSYYVRRAEQAMDLATRANSQEIRAIHLDMAARYAELSDGVAAARQNLSNVPNRI
jgi:hypothetical protein